jgi:transposase
MGRLTEREKSLIVFWKGAKKSNREIAQLLGRGRRTIDAYVLKIFPKPQIDRQSKIDLPDHLSFDPILREYVLSETLADRFISCRKLCNKISADSRMPIKCGKSTIAKIRRELGFKYQWATKVEKLTPDHIRYRYEWAQEIQKRPCFNLPWIISDESSFVLCPSRAKLYRFRGENTPCVFQEFAGYPVKCMVWGAIGPNYKSPLIWFRDGVNSKNYIQALDANHIFHELNIQFPEGYIYQQDGARPHTASQSMEYLAANVEMLPSDCRWPASSPDLSPIEEIWSYIKRKIYVPGLKTPEELFLAVQSIWENIGIDMINRLMESLKPRIFALEDLGVRRSLAIGI